AQSERGTISGPVLDPTGAVVPGAKVTIIHKTTNTPSISVSNVAGAYVVPSLPPGDYSIRVEQEGFRTAGLNEVTINAAASVRADITMEVGTSQQTVTGSAEAIAINTDSAKSATVITQRLVDDLPAVVGGALRSPFDLAILSPESKNFGDNNFQLG